MHSSSNQCIVKHYQHIEQFQSFEGDSNIKIFKIYENDSECNEESSEVIYVYISASFSVFVHIFVIGNEFIFRSF